MCEIRAARIIYELAPSRALCAAIRRTLSSQVRSLSASDARSCVQKFAATSTLTDGRLPTIDQLAHLHTTAFLCSSAALYM
ncbi:hypothetical protein C0Z16_35585 [Paraburkholderia rhynchosiae]|uniref:Uncharacterized protein n=1 Tax=Paraburkholderia rhynchosiae TaxID=487049 RepID=A0ABX4UY07_9BURK|nr:hypothetical protein C0Z16_35585 [Paraburkholderia rhynchosiae]